MAHAQSQGFVIEEAGITHIDEEIYFAAHAFDEVFGQVFHAAVGLPAPGFVHGAESTFNFYFIGNDVGSAPCRVDFAKSKNRRHSGIVVAAHDLLQRGDHVRGHQDRIDAVVGHGTVATFARDGDVQFVAGAHVATRAKTNLARRQGWMHVLANNGSGAGVEQDALFDHQRCAAGQAFFSGLKDEFYSAFPIIAGAVQDFGGTEQRRGVYVVPAGVHDAGLL